MNRGGEVAAHPLTTAGLFLARASRLPAVPVVHHHRDGRWRAVSWAELRERALRVACGLVQAGIETGDRVLLLSENRLEWLACDLGIQLAGAVPVPIHPSAGPEAAQTIASSSAAFLAIASGEERAARLHLTDALGRILRVDGEVARWLGAEVEERTYEEVTRRLSRLGPGDAATIVSDSADAAAPRSVVLTHRACVEMARHCVDVFHVRPSDTVLSVQSFADVAERLWSLLVPAVAGAAVWMSRGAPFFDEDVRAARPTLMHCGPPVLERLRRAAEDRPGPGPRLPRWLADRLVLSSRRHRIGGGRLRFLVTGDGPLRPDLEEFFVAAGLPVHRGVGAVDEHGFRKVAWPNEKSDPAVGPRPD